MINPVKADGHSGMSWSPLQLFGKSARFSTRCGNCKLSFYVRPAMVDQPGVLCPNPKCHAVNILDLYVPKCKPLSARFLVWIGANAVTFVVYLVRRASKIFKWRPNRRG